jgi:hypothetical protein
MEKELTGEEQNWGCSARFSYSTGNTNNLPLLLQKMVRKQPILASSIVQNVRS